MKAVDLIKSKGLEYAKDIVYNAPSNALEWNEGYLFKCSQSAEKISKKDKEKYFVSIPDLRQLVESHELVGRYGTVDEAKEYLPMLRMDSYDELKQAIADVESCMEVNQ